MCVRLSGSFRCFCQKFTTYLYKEVLVMYVLTILAKVQGHSMHLLNRCSKYKSTLYIHVGSASMKHCTKANVGFKKSLNLKLT